MLPTVSIITVCYNEENNIRKTCESVISQSFQDFEWIVIDGGSKDKTVDILEGYKDHITYLISEKDKGIYNAMNKGIAQAKGKYFLFLNGGDYLKDTQVLAHIFHQEPVEDILYGDICLESEVLHKSLVGIEELDFKFFLRPQSLNHQATFIKGSLFEEYGTYDESFKYAADYDWFLRVFSLGKDIVWKRIDKVISVFDPNGMSESKALRPTINHEIIRAQDKYNIPFIVRWPARVSFFLHRCLWRAYITYVFIKKSFGKTS